MMTCIDGYYVCMYVSAEPKLPRMCVCGCVLEPLKPYPISREGGC
jgi:hypothetical protein